MGMLVRPDVIPPRRGPNACTNAFGARKRAFRTEAAARRHLREQRAPGYDVDALHPYRCATCDRWHLGHKKP